MTKRAMTQAAVPRWERMRTDETKGIEELFRQNGFPRVDAYRYNSASIRIRVVDPRFEGMPIPEREDLVFAIIDLLDRRTREDILLLLILAPSEVGSFNRHLLVNQEFENPLSSSL